MKNTDRLVLQPPKLPESVPILQEKISAQAEIVESGMKPQPAILRFIPRDPQKIPAEERFTLLKALLADCTTLHAELMAHREALVSFFTALALHMRDLLRSKVGQIAELENKRKSLLKVAQDTEDEGLSIAVTDLQQRLGRFLRIICMGTILVLRSIERCRKALDTLQAEEQRRQQMINRVALRINAHTEMKALEDQLQDFAETSGVAADDDFLSYRRDYWIPFQDLVREVRTIDETLRSAADEIMELATVLAKARPGDAPFASMEESAVDSLLHGEAEELDQASAGMDVALAFGKEPSFDRALKNIETLVQTRLEDCFGYELNVARLANTPRAWREYLVRYRSSAGAEEALTRLKHLEEDHLRKARAPSTAWDSVPLWRAFVEEFPDSEKVNEAQDTILQLRAETLAKARSATDPHEARAAWHTFAVLFPDRTKEESREFLEGFYGALVRAEPTPNRWREYLAACPKGPLAAEAKQFVDAYAWVPVWATAWGIDSTPNAARWADLEVNGVRQRFRFIQPGVFLMGRSTEEDGNENEVPQHEVLLTRPFWLAETECAQAFWKAVTGTNPSKFQKDDHPVETVSWEDCVMFTSTLNKMVAGMEARLPTEAEWEYACRAGSTGPFAGSGLWQEMAWVSENADGQSHATKQRLPNAWGMYDMHGNVSEWVSDGARSYVFAKTIDPVGPDRRIMASHRGGSWAWSAHGARSASRYSLHRDVRGPELGFRLAVSASSHETGWAFHASGGHILDRLAVPPQHGIFLGDVDPLRVRGPYPPTANDAWGVHHCRIGRKICSTFITVHPPGEFVWPIPDEASQFRAVLGRADEVPTFHATWSYQILIDEKTVFQSPPLYESRQGIPVEIDLPPDATRLTVITDPLGDHVSDHAILAWPYFVTKPPLERLSTIAKKSIFLGDLTPAKSEIGCCELRVYKNADEQVLPIEGKPCKDFVELHPPSFVTYEIPDGAHRFTAIGSRWNRKEAEHGTWKYQILIDDVEVLDSVPFHAAPEGIPIEVLIPGKARTLTIQVDDLGDNTQDWSILAYPYFHFTGSPKEVAQRIGLKPGEVAFRTSAGGWFCAFGEDLVVVNNPLEPGARFEWHWRGSSECLFNLRAASGQYVRVQSDGRVRLMGPPDSQKEYFTLIHASDGTFAIRCLGPYLTVEDRVVTAKHKAVGPNECFEIVDVNYPPPPRSAEIDGTRLIEEAILHLDEEKRIESGVEFTLARPLNGSAFSILFRLCYESYERDRIRAFWFSQFDEGRERIALYTSWGRLAWRCNGKDVAYSRGEFQLRKWHHVAIVVDGMRNHLYVDGFAQMNGSCRVHPSATAPLWFGRSADGVADSICDGAIADLLILNRPLTGKEVRCVADSQPDVKRQG